MLGLGSLGLGAKAAMGIGILTVAIGGAFLWYYNSTQEELATLNENLGKQRVAREVAEASLDRTREQISRQSQELSRLADEMAATRRAQDQVSDIFAEHDLGNLASERPGLIETRVNDGTEDVLNQLEDITDPRTYEGEGSEDDQSENGDESGE